MDFTVRTWWLRPGHPTFSLLSFRNFTFLFLWQTCRDRKLSSRCWYRFFWIHKCRWYGWEYNLHFLLLFVFLYWIQYFTMEITGQWAIPRQSWKMVIRNRLIPSYTKTTSHFSLFYRNTSNFKPTDSKKMINLQIKNDIYHSGCKF